MMYVLYTASRISIFCVYGCQTDEAYSSNAKAWCDVLGNTGGDLHVSPEKNKRLVGFVDRFVDVAVLDHLLLMVLSRHVTLEAACDQGVSWCRGRLRLVIVRYERLAAWYIIYSSSSISQGVGVVL